MLSKAVRCAVVGAGPCGIGVVGRLVDLGHEVTWIDEAFKVGRMGPFYRNVPANTLNGDLLYATRLCSSFQFEKYQSERRIAGQTVMTDLAEDRCFDLGYLVDPLVDATEYLKGKVKVVQGRLQSIEKSSPTSPWHYKVLSEDHVFEQRGDVDIVIDMCGCRPVHIPGMPLVVGDSPPLVYEPNGGGRHLTFHSLDLTVNPSHIQQLLQQYPSSDTWTVVGSSHSGMLVVKNLVEAGARHVNLVHRSPIRFMELKTNGCKKYQGTGLKGPVGDWTRAAIERDEASMPFRMIKYDPSKAWYDQLSAISTDHVVLAMGFVREDNFTIAVGDVTFASCDLDNYDRWIGHIPLPDQSGNLSEQDRYVGLFGGGIAFPQNHRDEEGEVEPWVGFKRSIEQTDLMLQYHLEMAQRHQN